MITRCCVCFKGILPRCCTYFTRIFLILYCCHFKMWEKLYVFSGFASSLSIYRNIRNVWRVIFFFIFQAQKVSEFFRVSVSWDIRKVLFLKFLNIKARNLHFPKYKQFFSGWIFFYSLSLDLKSAPGSSILYYWRHPHLCFSFTNFQIFCEQVVFISFLFNFEITL